MNEKNNFVEHLAAQRKIFSDQLVFSNGIVFRFLSGTEYDEIVNKNFSLVFDTAMNRHIYTADENKRCSEIWANYKNLYHDYILGFDSENQYVGHFSGETEDLSTFYLRNAGLMPQYRNQKIASRFMKTYLNYLFSLGYSRVTSQHHGNNSAVLIMMLKLGFHVSGFEAREEWGLLIKCTKLLSIDREQLFDSLIKGVR